MFINPIIQMRKEEGYAMSRCSQGKAAWSLDCLSGGGSKKTALLAHRLPPEHVAGGDQGLVGLPVYVEVMLWLVAW